MKFDIKKIIFYTTLFISLVLLVFLVNIVYSNFMNKLALENDVSKVSNTFGIDKIVLFSSCSADSNINSNNTTTINNLTQYTDIAVFINNSATEFNLENTLKSVSIKDIVFNETPTNGIPNLYYKSLTSFATPDVLEENKIDSTLDFSVTSSDEIDYSSPTLYNNCANPITLCYVNSNIVNNYTIDNSNSIAYDGSLLKSCNVLLNNIKAKISFTIYIENNQGEKFRCPVYIDIPLGEGDVSIYDGSYTYTYNPEYVFYKY